MKVEGKVVIVTGAASGLGRTTAEQLGDEGARVVLVDLQADPLAELAKRIDALALACDVADGPASETAFDRIVTERGRPHVLVNCAGIAPGVRIVKRDGPGSLAEFERVVRVNLFGTYNRLRLAAAAMAKNTPDEEGQRGVIINTASIAAYDGKIGQILDSTFR